jgi:hypothetical protein
MIRAGAESRSRSSNSRVSKVELRPGRPELGDQRLAADLVAPVHEHRCAAGREPPGERPAVLVGGPL